jgi:pimeloyl-ACP methyl ester carboxylesterase
MDKTTSADGTTIAYDVWGDDVGGGGPVVVLVGGAFCDRGAFAELGPALAAEGLTAVSYDRRGRGDSGDTEPYAVEREIEDLTAVIEAVSPGQPAFVHGLSSGGALVLAAVAAGAPVARASMLEPPYRLEGGPSAPEDYIGTLRRMTAADDRAGIVEYFHTRVVGMPAETLEPAKASPMWPALLALAPTVLYDALCMGGDDQSLPADLLSDILIPVLGVTSTGTALPWLSRTAEVVAAALPDGRAVRLEGGFHEVPPAVLAPALVAFYRGESD